MISIAPQKTQKAKGIDTHWTKREYVLVNLYFTKELLLPLPNSLLSLFLHLLLKLFKLFYPPTMSKLLTVSQVIHFSIDWFEEIIQKLTAQMKQNKD